MTNDLLEQTRYACDLRNDIISECDAWSQREGLPSPVNVVTSRAERRGKIVTDRGSTVFEHPTQLLLGLSCLMNSIKDLHLFPDTGKQSIFLS